MVIGMADHPLQSYIPSKIPPLKGSDQKWLDEELRKIEKSLMSIIETLKALKAQVDALP